MQKIKCQNCKLWVEPNQRHSCPNCEHPLETAGFESESISEDQRTSGSIALGADNADQIDKTAGPADDTSTLPIRLEYQHTFCKATQHGSIPLRLTNLGCSTITELELFAESTAFSSYKPPPPRKIKLSPQTHTQYLPLDFDLAPRSGRYTVEVKGYCLDEKETPNAFYGLFYLIVREPDFKGTKVTIDDVWGGDFSNLLDLDAISDLQITNSGGIDGSRDSNGPPVGYDQATSADNWLTVKLEEDFERTRSLIHWQKKKKEPPSVSSKEPRTTSPVPRPQRCTAAMLTFSEGSEERTVHIWNRPQCRLGRSEKECDLICVRLPFNPNNALISRLHCKLEIKNNSVYLQDLTSTHGTFLDHQRIQAATPLRTGQIISLARQMDLDFRAFHRIDHSRQVSQIFNTCNSLSDCSRSLSLCNLKGESRSASLECFQLRRRDAYRQRLEYLFVQTAAPIGASSSAGVQLNHASVESLHARLLYKDQALFIEDVNSPGGTWVDGHRIEPYTSWPLGAEAEIQLGEQRLRYQRLAP